MEKRKIGLMINETPRTCGEKVFTSFTSDPQSKMGFVWVLFNLIDSWRKDRSAPAKSCRELNCGLSDEKESPLNVSQRLRIVM